uniref:peptide-methionine (S)-S-oxide reductase n=1 Tax=Pelagomonas calceolata TaxID=35677 RepID=A0A7S3ZLB7_9STRA
MHLSSSTLLVLLASTQCHAFAPAAMRARAPSPRAQWWEEDGTAPDAGATTTAKATGEHQIKAGDHVRLHYSLTTTGGQALDGAELTFDTEEVDLVVGAGGFLPALHNALDGASLTVDAPETMTLSAPFGERDPRLGPIPVPAANAPKGMQPGDRAGLSNGATARVMSVSDEKVVIDANHLYAGEDLTLTVTLLEPPNGRPLQEATFAGGCFWGVELAYQREPGVVRTEVGYAQGADPSPSYEAVCSGVTGHTEAVRVRYDPSRVSYERLCDLLLDRLGENRYALNRVGNDQGTQYRHGIYFSDDAQQATAEAVIAREQQRDAGRPIVTEVERIAAYYAAEAYHQQYLEKGGQSARKKETEPIRCYG